MPTPLSDILTNSKQLFDSFFESYTKELFQPQTRITDACLYSLKAGGKRIRPIFVLNSFFHPNDLPKILNTKEHHSVYLASLAVECIHTYSLIHDDLPAMDDDDTRRGMPTCHVQFDEATAILAGDTLNSLSFYLLSLYENTDSAAIRDSIQILHRGAGMNGMILGQMEDIEEEKNPSAKGKESKLTSIHEKKTGALIEASFLLGNRLRPDWIERETVISSYAKEIGLLFQITDDILDVEGNLAELGKTPGKDAKAGKLTYPSLYGMETAKKLRDESVTKAISLVSNVTSLNNEFFLGLPKYIAERKN
ncbi:polyprenyl synthetase family protein [Leptospira sp. 2 VSF19]|uniref:Polyprenyl synthetase family protein n=1 Tax=Leptospira soteropolitanensis TaxID=2950025 RepID=A0AAW5VG91_9LEPT|nr:polyprenyl synthetase family protein [Leptospira soteropolitanensis]MCW7491630.1 polyprenyl synthetase family protein [Leptospira soteropolitanensis]MCW7499214.1 polyprenyl synthetase family protein [Leptospira soteropolitanensis]MCW7521194.1 polyprenyl synthetase family protein [Leptospira soteropolitanensis]MCW7525318.1 polyprenyl synthetase family protein [Leptospira soteropolitanensis]MCW7529185.1 polyprenyl synthetase family protein [Leptospira soteropolitanensis]